MPITQGSATQLGSATLGSSGATALSGASALTNLCAILANQGGADGMGGFLENWAVIAANVPCAIKALVPATERMDGDKITAVGIYEFTLPSDTAITPANRIRFGGFDFVLQDRAIPIPNQSTISVRARLIE